MASSLLISIFLLLSQFIFSLSSPLPTETILDAAEILSDTGYVSMSLTLELVSDTLLPNSHSLTVFAPANPAFTHSGQPSLPLLQFHFSLLPLPLETLKSLPYGTEIPTMYAGRSLTVTSSPSDDRVSLNNVEITESPIFDDGLLIIYGIYEFFDLDFEVRNPLESNLGCGLSTPNPFGEASGVLRSVGYSVMAQFLDLQMLETKKSTMMTVFAPTDQVMLNSLSNYSKHSSMFLRHVVPCRLLWTDLVKFNDGTALPTYSDGFTINITRSGGILMLNRVPVYFPNMYLSDLLVVHGLRQTLAVLEGMQETAGASDEFRSSNEGNVPVNYEF